MTELIGNRFSHRVRCVCDLLRFPPNLKPKLTGVVQLHGRSLDGRFPILFENARPRDRQEPLLGRHDGTQNGETMIDGLYAVLTRRS